MKLVSLETNKFFTRGKIYTVIGHASYGDSRCLLDDNFEWHFIDLPYLLTNFSVLTFDTNFKGVN